MLSTTHKQTAGKVVDKHAEAAAKRRELADKARQRAEWNVGTVQKRKAEADREAVVKAAAAPFARYPTPSA